MSALATRTPHCSQSTAAHSIPAGTKSTGLGSKGTPPAVSQAGLSSGNAHSSGDGVSDEIARTIESMQVQIGDNVPQWKDVVDVEGTKKDLERAILHPMKRPDLYTKNQRNGILLYGPPGCGKTILVQSIMRECKCKMLSVTASAIFSKWQGHTENSVILSNRLMIIAADYSEGLSPHCSTKPKRLHHALYSSMKSTP